MVRTAFTPVPNMTNSGHGNSPSITSAQIVQQITDATTNPVTAERRSSRHRAAARCHGRHRGEGYQVGEQRRQVTERASRRDRGAPRVELLAVEAPVGVGLDEHLPHDVAVDVGGAQRGVPGVPGITRE
jgi:hypothetical protein